MMSYKKLKNQLEILADEIISIVVEACQLVFNQSFDIKIGEDSAITDQPPESSQSGVVLAFDVLASAGFHHRLQLSESQSLKLLAWMLQEEPEEKLLPEHTEGIQEAANQILGQLRTALDGMGLKIEVKNMTVSLSEPDEAESWTPPAEEGIRVSYTMATGEDTFIVDHYFWQTSAADQNTDIVPEPELDVDALFADDPLEGANGEEAEQTGDKAVKVHPADFSSLTDNPGTNGQPRNINMLLDVELDINVELGKKVMQVKDVLKLGKGTVVELDKAAGEPLDLFVSGRKFAEGEVVVVDDHFGIRITQLAGAKKRLESLGK